MERLFDDAWRYLLTIARRHLPRDLRSKVDASDLVQETFLKAHRALPDFPGQTERDLKLWLRRILLNHLCNVARHYRGTGKRDVAREVPIAAGGEHAGGSDEPAAVLITQEMHDALWRAVDQLPEQHRQVVRWRNVDRLGFPEIARRLGNSEDAARKVWERALEKLARMLRRKGERSETADEGTDEPLPVLLPFCPAPPAPPGSADAGKVRRAGTEVRRRHHPGQHSGAQGAEEGPPSRSGAPWGRGE